MNEEQELESIMRQLPLDDAPRPEHVQMLRQQVLDAYDRAEASSNSHVQSETHSVRRRIMFITKRFAIPLAAAAAVWFLATSMLYPTSAFADVVDRLLKAQTARYKMSVKSELQPAMTFDCQFKAPDKFRQENADAVNISNFSAGRIVSLVKKEKQAIVLTLKGAPQGSMQDNYFDLIRRILKDNRDKSDRQVSLGEKEQDGRRLVGFRVAEPGRTLEIWGDAKTREPVQVRVLMESLPKMEVVMSEFAFDLALEDSLFDTSIPPGYREIASEVDVSQPTERDLVRSLESAAKELGKFPPALDAATIAQIVAGKLMKEKKQPNDAQFKEMMERSLSIGRGFSFALRLDADRDAHYAGKGVKLGDKNRPIFWYRPAGDSKYRVIDAELHVAESDTAPDVKGAVKLSESVRK